MYLAMVAGAVSARDLVKVTEIKKTNGLLCVGELGKAWFGQSNW